jgi:hypothetical protein
MIQKAFGNEAMGCTQVKEWFRQFKDGCWSRAINIQERLHKQEPNDD